MLHSVILIPTPLADPVIGTWRKQYDRVALHGIPSHITLLFPFKEPSKIPQKVIRKLKVLFSNIKQFSFSLEKVNTFPNVVFLEPNSREKFIVLTEKIVDMFPENPPWEGKFPSIHPHATIANIGDSKITDSLKVKIEADISNKLPIHCIAKEAWLLAEDENGEWHIQTKFPFHS